MKYNHLPYQQKKASRCFVFIVCVNLLVSGFIIGGMVYGIHGYMGNILYTYRSVTCCKDICMTCLFSIHSLIQLFSFSCVLAFSTGFGMAMHKAFSLFVVNRRFIRSLHYICPESHPSLKKVLSRLPQGNYSVVLFQNKAHYAFTSGFLKPKIYISTAICSYLTSQELQAVILHEIHHVKDKTPLRLGLLHILCSFNFFLPVNRYVLPLYKLHAEKAADDASLDGCLEPFEIAGILLKLSGLKTTSLLQSTFPAFLNEQQIRENRILHLLEPYVPHANGRKQIFIFSFSFFLSFLVFIILFASFFLHGQFSGNTKICKIPYCHLATCE